MKFSSVALSAIVAPLAAGFTPMLPPPLMTVVPTSNFIASATQPPSAVKDELLLKSLEKEVKEAEKLAKEQAKAARIEKGREVFFEYEAKRAAEDEARVSRVMQLFRAFSTDCQLTVFIVHCKKIEAAEQKFAAEVKKDEEEVLKLKAAIKFDEEQAAKATSKEEKAKKLAEAKVSIFNMKIDRNDLRRRNSGF